MKRLELSGNQLKIIALLTMTVDHIGFILLPQYLILRIIGRLSFPIFAYMIAEGCRYTRSVSRYLGLMAGLGLVTQVVQYVAAGSIFQCIFVTFGMSIGLIWLLRLAVEQKKAWAWPIAILAVVAIFFLTRVLPLLIPGFDVDYGFWGVMLPAVIYFGKNHWQKLSLTAVVLLLMYGDYGWVQLFSLLALPLLALYNGQRGKWKLKYLFYIYYPVHLAILYLIAML